MEGFGFSINGEAPVFVTNVIPGEPLSSPLDLSFVRLVGVMEVDIDETCLTMSTPLRLCVSSAGGPSDKGFEGLLQNDIILQVVLSASLMTSRTCLCILDRHGTGSRATVTM